MKSVIYLLSGFFILNITIRMARGDVKVREKKTKSFIGILIIIIITFIICESI
ncbi:hypothetical protein [Oceanirhabdus sp. W0125-5]|uniref:hypothetical protein n=1 Tax=Oceanirhabdus sp. W0125-5 TaxID=2999116 RepID=UPI0022F2BD4B|nr:hypothetical protein [Oceanirhabdus sp. W0125-5]WBW94679.1 hypothetical protein OW730_13335 [Oceanirhabdus sp. W0125-5]